MNIVNDNVVSVLPEGKLSRVHLSMFFLIYQKNYECEFIIYAM